jgi:hypothetical protein
LNEEKDRDKYVEREKNPINCDLKHRIDAKGEKERGGQHGERGEGIERQIEICEKEADQ